MRHGPASLCILELLLQNPRFKGFCDMIRNNSEEFEAQGRVLRLKQFIRADAKQAQIDAILDALEDNTRVEALYIQNFEMVSIASPAIVLGMAETGRGVNLQFCCIWSEQWLLQVTTVVGVGADCVLCWRALSCC